MVHNPSGNPWKKQLFNKQSYCIEYDLEPETSSINPIVFCRLHESLKTRTHLEVALVWHDFVIPGGVPAEEDRREGDERGCEPRVEQHDRHHPLGHVDGVLERLDDRVVPVHADTAEM